MAGLRLLHSIHREETQCVDRQLIQFILLIAHSGSFSGIQIHSMRKVRAAVASQRNHRFVFTQARVPPVYKRAR
jgi:hypothetical protein